MAQAVLRNEQVKGALGVVRDKVTAVKISVSSPEGLKLLDLAVRKATSHEDIVPKEKHVRTIKQVRMCQLGHVGSVVVASVRNREGGIFGA